MKYEVCHVANRDTFVIGDLHCQYSIVHLGLKNFACRTNPAQLLISDLFSPSFEGDNVPITCGFHISSNNVTTSKILDSSPNMDRGMDKFKCLCDVIKLQNLVPDFWQVFFFVN